MMVRLKVKMGKQGPGSVVGANGAKFGSGVKAS